MRLIKVVFSYMLFVSLAGCAAIEQNAGVDLEQVFRDGLASFEEPLGLDQPGKAPVAGEVSVPSEVISNPAVVAGTDVRDSELPPEKEAIRLALLESAAAAENKFEYDVAALHYSRLVELNPLDIGSVIGLTRNLRYSGRPKDSVLLLKRVLPKFPGRSEILIDLAKAQIASGLIAESEEVVASLLKDAPGKWEVYALRGILLDHAGKHLAAQASYGEALTISPNNLAVLNNMSLSLAQGGELDAAIRLLEGLVRSEYSTAQVRQNLALLYALRGDHEAANELAEQDLPSAIVTKNWSAFRLLKE